jgi:glycosyltransferase involved in cell wall biosynthesis
MNRILFISHESSRTGAPLALLYLIQWMNEHYPSIKTDVLMLKQGVIENDFKKINGRLISLEPKNFFTRKINGFLYRIFKKSIIEWIKMHLIKYKKYNIIYANTIVSIPKAIELKNKNSNYKVIAHIHELELTIKHFLPNIDKYIKDIDFYICASRAVQENLIKNWKVDKLRSKVVYEFSKIDTFTTDDELPIAKSFTIGASGYVSWRKGYDIFIQIAYEFQKKYPTIDMVFKWVGKVDNYQRIIIENDLKKMGLSNKVEFLGEPESPSELYSHFDVFLMTSREDPFPLVCIECGMLGKPIICFDSATGTEEIIKENGGGFVVKYLDVEEVIEKLKFYHDFPEKLEEHGNINRNTFSKFTPEYKCPEIYHSLANFIK